MAFKVVGRGNKPPEVSAGPSGRFPVGLGSSGAPPVPRMGGATRMTRTRAMRTPAPAPAPAPVVDAEVVPVPVAKVQGSRVPSVSRVRVVPAAERVRAPRLFLKDQASALLTTLARLAQRLEARQAELEGTCPIRELAETAAGLANQFAEELADPIALLEPLGSFDVLSADDAAQIVTAVYDALVAESAEPEAAAETEPPVEIADAEAAPPETPRG